MTKKICAMQMDDLTSINVKLDSSFAIGLAAQRHGFKIFHYSPHHLTYHGDKIVDGKKIANLTARGHFVNLHHPAKAAHFSIDETIESMPLDSCDVIWLRQDPPFDMAYITNCHLLELLQATSQVLVVNNPRSVRSHPEKLAVLYFADLMPRTIISNDVSELQNFHAAIGDMVIKPLYGNGGLGVAFLKKTDPNLAVYVELQQSFNKNIPLMAQAFVKNIIKGDKRILLIDGEALGWFNRTPAVGQIRANTRAGGGAMACDLSTKDKEIVARLKPWLIAEELFFVGIDVIDGFLTEINVTSPTGIFLSDQLMGTHLADDIWHSLEKKLQARKK
ncbi:MAG: glutathione synthase [Alphaproteobacteria bacterium]